MKSRIAALFLSLIALNSCDEVSKLTQFTMNFDSQVTIPASTIVDFPFSITTPGVSTNSEAAFSQNETSSASIDEIKMQMMTLTINVPANGNFNFFKSVEVFMNASGLSEVSLGSNTDVADGLTSLELATSGVNIKEYIKKEEFSLRVAITTDETISQEQEINIKTVVLVDAKVLGQ